MQFSIARNILLSAALATAGCSEVLDTHSSGVGPNGPGALPGAPSGDSITATGNVLFNDGGQQLSANGTGTTGVTLITGGKPHNTTEYLINFRGVKLTITDTPVLAVDTFDTEDRQACGLEIAGGEFRLVSGNGTAVIGTYSGQADIHTVLMRLNRTAARCYVGITQVAQGTDGPLTQPEIAANAPFVSANFGDLDRMRVRWESTASSDATSYFLGRTVISKRN